MQQVPGLVNLFCNLSTLTMPNRKHFKREKNLHAFFLVLWSPLLSLCMSLRRDQLKLEGHDCLVAQYAHRGNKTRQRTRTLLFLRIPQLTVTSILQPGAVRVTADPNLLRSAGCMRAIRFLCRECAQVTQIFHYRLDNSNYSPCIQGVGHRGVSKADSSDLKCKGWIHLNCDHQCFEMVLAQLFSLSLLLVCVTPPI